MLKLYTGLGTIGLACEIALEEAGATYDVQRLKFAEDEQRKAPYLAINPKSRVPSLEIDQGVITETPAILDYVARTFPHASLAPLEDPFQMARLLAFTSYLAGWVHPAAAHRVRGNRWADDPDAIAELRRKAPLVFADAMALIEIEYLQTPWIMGPAYSVADPYFYVVTTWLARDGIDIAQFPKIEAHFARMGERPAVQRVLARVAAG